MPKARNNWYHVTVHTYGSWLRGDPRGWRSRNHREHVEGDYKDPPIKDSWGREFEHSKSLMKRPAVKVGVDLRPIVIAAVVEKLQLDGIEVIVVSFDAIHLHLLGRFNDHQPKHWVGRAKKHSSHVLRQKNLRTETGGIWAKNCHTEPIVDRAHQLRAFDYIKKHREKGAVLWQFTPQKKPADSNPQASYRAQNTNNPL